MSHLVKIKASLTDTDSIIEACKRLKIKCETGSQVRFHDSTILYGTAVHLPGWKYPVVITNDGECCFDNLNGDWGDIAMLGEFRQNYAHSIEDKMAALLGWVPSETTVEDNGDLVITYIEGV